MQATTAGSAPGPASSRKPVTVDEEVKVTASASRERSSAACVGSAGPSGRPRPPRRASPWREAVGEHVAGARGARQQDGRLARGWPGRERLDERLGDELLRDEVGDHAALREGRGGGVADGGDPGAAERTRASPRWRQQRSTAFAEVNTTHS